MSVSRVFRWVGGLLFILSLGVAACEDGSLTTGGGDTGATGGATDGSGSVGDDGGWTIDARGDAEEDDSGTSADLEHCPAKRICGRDCCTANESCIKGQCLSPCQGARCGKNNQKCCTGADVCLYNQCVQPGKSCSHNRQCPKGKICEPTLKKCVPDPGIQCEYKPGTQVFDPDVKLAWHDDANTPAPSYNQVMMTPSVVDIDESGVPDIIFSTFKGGAYNDASIIRIIDGKTFKSVADLTSASKRVAGSATLSVGDIDTDGKNEIVGVRPGNSGLIALDDYSTNYKVLWEAGGFSMSWDSAVLVDLNADGNVEVVGANRVFDGATGQHLCTGQGMSGSPLNATAADLDGDGNQEVVSANGAFEFQSDGSGGYTCPQMFTYGGAAGYPAIGDFGTFAGGTKNFGTTDGKPEIAVVVPQSGGTVQLYNGQTGARIWSSSIPNSGHPHFSQTRCNKGGAGAPTVADFDGDGEAEVATAGACFYAVFETDGQLLWKHPSQDFSSSQTGSSVFDFQGDGAAEAVYADECFIRVYKGAGNGNGTTSTFFKRAHSSGTTRELPVIVDVDGDFNSEIVLISNDYSTGTVNACKQNWPKFSQLGGGERGILVIEDKKNRWVPTRPVWNQHAYHVTNVCDGVNKKLCPGRTNKPGAIPVGQKDNWKQSYLNNFRQNVQGEGIFDAPDLVVTDVTLSNARCDSNGLKVDVNVEVANRGARGIPKGATTEVYAKKGSNTRAKIKTVQTTQKLLPGQSERLSFTWSVPQRYMNGKIELSAEVDTDKKFNECREMNNTKKVEFADISSLAPTLEYAKFEVDDDECASTAKLGVSLTLKNPGSNVVPAGVPVEITVSAHGRTRTLGTLTTSKKLPPNATAKLSGNWSIPSRFVTYSKFEVKATIDPDSKVFQCGGGKKKETASCKLGG